MSSCPVVIIETVKMESEIDFYKKNCKNANVTKTTSLGNRTRSDEQGTTFITFSESYTKTRPGGLRKKEKTVKAKMFATGADRCPVLLFNL